MHANRYTQGAHEYDVTMVVRDAGDNHVINEDEHSVVWAKRESTARNNAIEETYQAYMGNVLVSVKRVERI